MKVCKYCGTENTDSATVCSNCGANAFKNKCSNCGTIFEGGNFCPKCGVKAGTKAKKCPNCGAEYYSAACPDCGYINNYSNSADIYTSTAVKPVKKRKTWLWVLGWIFIFPVPLTILMLQNKKLNKWVRIGIIAAAWIFYVVMAAAGDSDAPDGNTKNTETSSVSETASSDSDNISADTGRNNSAQSASYTEDEAANNFIKELSYGKNS